MNITTPIFRDYPYIDLYPYFVMWFQVGAILLFLGIIFYLPRFMRWLDAIEKEKE